MAIASVVALIPITGGARWVSQALNAAHVIFFGILAILWLLSLRQLTAHKAIPSVVVYLLAALISGLFGGIIEIAQFIGPRDADSRDWLGDWVGIAGFLGVWWLGENTGVSLRRGFLPLVITVFAVLSVGVLLLATPFGGWLGAYWQRAAAFPTLADFSRQWSESFLRPIDADFERVYFAPKDSEAYWAGRLTIIGGKSPGIELIELRPDWSSFDALMSTVRLEHHSPQELVVRIEDASHDQSVADRFKKRIVLQPGPNRIQIDLSRVRAAPASRSMDMGHIQRVVFFVPMPAEPLDLYFGNIWLE